MWMRLACLLALSLACAPTAPIRYETQGDALVTADGLHRVKTRAAVGGRVYLKPGADFHRYTHVMLDPVSIRYRRGPGRHLDPEMMQKVEGWFREAFEGELAKSSIYTVVEEPGPDVLRVTARVVDLVITAPAEPSGPRATIVDTTGAMTLLLELSDSQSHESLVRVAERQKIQDPSGRAYATSVPTNAANARFLFRHWALMLRRWLDNVREIPPLPTVEQATTP